MAQWNGARGERDPPRPVTGDGLEGNHGFGVRSWRQSAHRVGLAGVRGTSKGSFEPAATINASSCVHDMARLVTTLFKYRTNNPDSFLNIVKHC